jgi:hypothetical protein
VADLNGDGRQEVLVADGQGCVYAWNQQGVALAGFPVCTGQNNRIDGPVAIGNLDGDPGLEIVAGSRGSGNAPGQRARVFVWDTNGALLWSYETDWNQTYGNSRSEIHGVALADVSGDARLEVLAGTSNNTSNGGTVDVDIPWNLYVFDASGNVLPGFPAYNRTAGIYAPVGAADLTGDGKAEIITGRDHNYAHAYASNGSQLSGWPVRTYYDPAKTVWGQDQSIVFTHNAPAMGDLNGDGVIEVVMAGDVQIGTATPTNGTVLVLEPNGQRLTSWTLPPLSGAPLTSSFPPGMFPALADLNGDGKLDIVVALHDGTIRAYNWATQSLWSYNYAQGRMLFASEPVIGDVTGDGNLDVIFGVYSPDGSANSFVGVYGLSASGALLPNFPLALTAESGSQKGVRAAPTLADLDCDGDVEILAASWGGTLYVWDLPTSYNPAKMPWPTGRHDNQRTGSVASAPGSAALSSFLAPAADPLVVLNPANGNALYLPLVVKNHCGG